MTETIAPPTAKPIHHWIGGKSVPSTSGRSGPVWNPATGEQTGAVDFATVEEIDAAVQTAKEAFTTWRSVSLSRRAELFFKIRQLVDEHRADIARFLTLEHGKVTSDALGEVARGLEVIEYACGIPTLLKGEYSEQASTGIDVYSIRQPLGVVAGITPFNFPAMVPDVDVGAGDRLREHVRAQALREGSLRVGLHGRAAQGGRPPGRRLQRRPRRQGRGRRASSSTRTSPRSRFVGSTPIARYVYETGTKNGKRMQALGGAKNHMIVLPDADIDMAADAAVSAAYGSAGERCMAVSVVVAVGDVADPLIDAIKQRLPKVKVGPGLEPGQRDGPADHARASRQGRRRYLDTRRRAGRDGRRRRPRARGRGRRLLPRRLADRRGDARDGRLPGRDLRAGARRSRASAPTTRRSGS